MSTILPRAVPLVASMFAVYLSASSMASDGFTIATHGKAKLALDVESLEVDGPAGVGKVWARTLFNPPSMFGDKKVVKLMNRYEVDCDTQKYALLRSVAYYGSGAVVGSSDLPEQMQATVPDTTADAVVGAVCAAVLARTQTKLSAR